MLICRVSTALGLRPRELCQVYEYVLPTKLRRAYENAELSLWFPPHHSLMWAELHVSCLKNTAPWETGICFMKWQFKIKPNAECEHKAKIVGNNLYWTGYLQLIIVNVTDTYRQWFFS